MIHRVAGICLVALLAGASTASAWGLGTHRFINERAIETLPDPLHAFFRSAKEQLSDLAVEPDTLRRRRFGRSEAIRHYIDLDLYGLPPFREVPRRFDEAAKKFGRPVVLARGTLPWTIVTHEERLARRIRRGEWRAALTAAGHAGHYVGDAFMPLHTTDNHDGQKSGNDGIHKAIEHGLVDARLAAYRARVEPRIGRPTGRKLDAETVFGILLDSYEAVPALLRADRAARTAGPPGSREYFDRLDSEVGAILAARIAAAIEALGSSWLAAWSVAGRPVPPAELP